jgi:hypothetical protein
MGATHTPYVLSACSAECNKLDHGAHGTRLCICACARACSYVMRARCVQIASLEKRVAELMAALNGQTDTKDGSGALLQIEVDRLKKLALEAKESCSKAEKERDAEKDEANRLREALKAYKDESDACNDRLIKQARPPLARVYGVQT